MNFNKDLIHNLEGKNISRTISGVKSTVEKVADELAAGTSKDISKGVAAEESMGRASFSMLNKVSQHELSQKVDTLIKNLGFSDGYYVKSLKDSCSNTDGTLNEKFVSLAENFYKLADKKDEKLKFVWEGYIAKMVEQCKNPDGTVNKEVKSSVEQLLNHDKVSVRGIPDIIDGCTNLKRTRDGRFAKEFDKATFDKFSDFMDINGKTMFEQDDVFTLYLGRTLKGCRRERGQRQQGEDILVDNVAFNFAKKLYEQGEDILDMEMFLHSFNTYKEEVVNGSKQYFSSGFEFNPNLNEPWAKKMLVSLKESIGSEKIIDACKVDGKDNFHNLLVADTLKKEAGLYNKNGWGWNSDAESIIEKLKNENGIIPTDKITYFCKPSESSPFSRAYDINACTNKNGTVNGIIYDKVRQGELGYKNLDLCRVNGEINYDNVDVLEHIQKTVLPNGQKYYDYQEQEVFQLLKNKDGVVDKKLLAPLDELAEITHLAPQDLKDCLTVNGDVDRTLFDLKKYIIKRNGYLNTVLPSICKKEDGSANLQGINAVKSMIDVGLSGNQTVLRTFENKSNYDYKGLNDFIQVYSNADKQYRENALNLSIVGEYLSANNDTRTVDIDLFKSLLDTMSNPEIAPLMKSRTNSLIVKSKTNPISYSRYKSDDYFMFSYIPKGDIEILEKNGYSARFFRELGNDKKYFVETPKNITAKFDKDFVNGDALERNLKFVQVVDDVESTYSRSELSEDISKILGKLPEDKKDVITRAFKIEFGEHGIEGFPQRFDLDTVAPTGFESEFKSLNSLINKFYSSEIKTSNPELKTVIEELSNGFPEFKMLIGKTNDAGERVDLKTIQDLKTLISSSEYQQLSPEDKSVAKMTVLLKNIENVDSKPNVLKKSYSTDNDGYEVKINAGWKKSAEYANAILDRYNMSEKDKYRTIQLLNDVGWSKKLAKGELTSFDIAINQRYKGDDVVSPLVEKVLTGECKFDKSAVAQEVKNIRKNQEVLLTSKLADFEPYIETTVVNGKELKYIDLNRPELKNKPILAHFLGYDSKFHTYNMLKNKAYRSSFSASIVNANEKSSCFAGRNEGIVFDFDNVNVANVHCINIESGFGKQYEHLKESMKSRYHKDIKETVMKELNLSEDEYGELMDKIIHSDGTKDITDCVINGKKLSRTDIILAHELGVSKIANSRNQNETTVMNARPVASIAIGESLDDCSVYNAVAMALYNDIPLLFKKISRA